MQSGVVPALKRRRVSEVVSLSTDEAGRPMSTATEDEDASADTEDDGADVTADEEIRYVFSLDPCERVIQSMSPHLHA